MAESGGVGARAAILAGGRATRLGGAKATVEFAGRPLIAHPVESAREAGLEPFVVAKRNSPLPELDCDLLTEPDEPTHPLVGILSALRACEGPIVALGCDMPFLTAPLLRWLAAHTPPAVAEVGGRLEPLLAVYGPADAGSLRGALDDEAPLREAVEGLGPTRIGEEELGRFGEPRILAMSVNSEADLAEAERLISG